MNRRTTTYLWAIAARNFLLGLDLVLERHAFARNEVFDTMFKITPLWVWATGLLVVGAGIGTTVVRGCRYCARWWVIGSMALSVMIATAYSLGILFTDVSSTWWPPIVFAALAVKDGVFIAGPSVQ